MWINLATYSGGTSHTTKNSNYEYIAIIRLRHLLLLRILINDDLLFPALKLLRGNFPPSASLLKEIAETARNFIVSVALTLHPPAKDCVEAKRGQQPGGRPQRPRTAYWRSLMTVLSVGELRLGRSVAWSFCGRTYHQGTKNSGGSRSGVLLEEQSRISIFENWEKTHATVSLNNDRSGQRINQAIEKELKTLGSSPVMRPIGT
jgi:hypothetical protein